MKLIILKFLCLVILINCVPPEKIVKVHPEERIFQKVIVHEFSKNDSFELISQWLAESYITTEIYTDYINKEKGKIIGSLVLPAKKGELKTPVKMIYTIETKDNRFRLTAKNFMWVDYSEAETDLEKLKVTNLEELNIIFLQIRLKMLNPIKFYISNSQSDQDW